MKIIDKTYNLFKREIHVRIRPHDYLEDLKKVDQLVAKKLYQEATVRLDGLIAIWGCEEELIYRQTVISFVAGE